MGKCSSREASMAEGVKGHKGNNRTFCDLWDDLNVNVSASVVRKRVAQWSVFHKYIL